MRDGEARTVQVGPRALACLVCEHDRFWERQATLPGEDPTGAEATCYVCERCSHVHWFAYRPRPVGV